MICPRVIIETPFYQKKIRSYGLIVYALNTNRCIVVQRKHSAEFIIIICGHYRKSYLCLLLKWITDQEIIFLQNLFTLTQNQFNQQLLDLGLDQADLNYAYIQWNQNNYIIQQFINNLTHTSYNTLNWTWPKGRLNVDDYETGYMCALREFEEEVEMTLPDPLYVSTTFINLNMIKTINNKLIETYCWLYVIQDEIELPLLVNHKEVMQRQWISLEEAVQLTNNENSYHELKNIINNL